MTILKEMIRSLLPSRTGRRDACPRRHETQRRVGIYSTGVISPIGMTVPDFNRNLFSGKTGMRRISLFDVSTFPAQVAAECTDYQPDSDLRKRRKKNASRQTLMALSAFRECFRSLGLDQEEVRDSDVLIGSASGSINPLEVEIEKSPTGSFQNFHKSVYDPFAMVKGLVSHPAHEVAKEIQARGYVSTLSSTCTSGVNAVGLLYDRIRVGLSDFGFAGATDCPLYPLMLTAFIYLRELSTDNDAPEKILRPYDKKRDRSALGEGSAMFFLAEMDWASSRGLRPLAEITGFAQSTESIEDDNDLHLPDPTGKEWARIISKAVGNRLFNGTLFVCGHGPSHKIYDRIEVEALKQSLENQVCRIVLSSIKSQVGNGLSSAGVFQILTAIEALRRRQIPPTVNFEEADPDNPFPVSKTVEEAPDISGVLVSSRGLLSVDAALVLEEAK